ncbi:hypothetical protein M231_04001 [Tremella mesenterica]|uniref:RRM domain-containing protein n=1 Tax=Tremella mesenterica TaxID=5217 RepID=A0A4Q1BLL1_TREME|nr:hypothetical protein M231_04001 [Tremella mesenterica]
MALADFFADTATGTSWADEMDNLPTAPAARDSSAPKRGEPGYLDSMPDRGHGDRPAFGGAIPARQDVPIPNAPPFTAHVGNLSYETEEDDLRAFFTELQPTGVRISKNAEGQPRGYAHVDFPTADKLRDALAKNSQQFSGRSIRISVAEPSAGRKDFVPSAAEEATQWRRAGPLPVRESPVLGTRRGPSFSPAEPAVERDWSAARGTKFVPAPPAVGLGIRRESSGAGRMRDIGPTAADEAGQWRSARPMVEARTPINGSHPTSGENSPSPADTEQTWARGTRFKSQEPTSRATTASPGEERDWRAARPSPQPAASPDGPEESPKVPTERRKLTLAPRSAHPSPSTTTTEARSPNTAIFGAAKPIDSAAREAAVESRLAAREAERKKAAQAAREEEARKEREEDEKARQFADERARTIKEAQQKAQAAINPNPTPTQNNHVSSGPPRRSSGPGVDRSERGGPRRGGHSVRGAKSPRVESDGFEVAQGTGTRRQAQNQPTVEKKKEAPRHFSFAAAAALVDEDLVDDVDDAEEETLAGSVEGVTKGLEDVRVEE